MKIILYYKDQANKMGRKNNIRVSSGNNLNYFMARIDEYKMLYNDYWLKKKNYKNELDILC